MGACNFASPVNADAYYVVLLPWEAKVEDDEGNETEEVETRYPERFHYEMLKETVYNQVKGTQVAQDE